jgi:type I restriction enzyme S subunit
MASELRELKISDVASIVGGGTPSTKNPEYWDGAIPWITPKDLSGYEDVFISRGSRSITEAGLKSSSAKLLPPNSVLYTSRAPIGYVAINNVEVATNQGFKSLIPKKGFDTSFLYYLLKYSKQQVLDLSAGGTFAEISASAMGEVVLKFPSHETQKAIGKFALRIDEKIQVNQQIASTLEQIAQTIFKSWFVDFDPVHAKSRGEQPVGMDAETAALFPDSFEDSELGPIPTGLGLNPLATNFQLISGGTPKTTNSDFWDGDIPWYSVVDAPSDSPFFVATSKYITKLGVEKSAVNLVDEGTTIISARGTVGKLAMAGVKAAFNQSCYGIKGKFADYFTYLLVQNSVKRLQAMTHGGTFDTITRTTFDAINVVTVPESVQIAFEELVQPLFEQMKLISHQNVTLAKCRDSLLPRLISGELEIPAELLEA